MLRKLSLIVPVAGVLFGLAACADDGTTAKEPAVTSPMASPATSAPTNPVTGTVPGPNSTGASPTSPGGSAGGSGGSGT
jgi:hypothetical protein